MECQCFQLPRCKRSAQRPTKAEVRGASPRGSTISNVDHVVTVSIPPCEGGGAGASPVGQPNPQSRTWRRDEPSVCKTDPPGASPGCASISISPVAQAARASDFDSEGDGASPSGAAIFISRRSPMQRQRAQTSSSAGASPAAGTNFLTDPKLRQRSSRLLTGGAGRTSLRVHQNFCGSEAGVTS